MFKLITFAVSLLCISNSYSSEAIGFYSKGSIINSSSIDEYSGDFEKLFRSRKRLFATDHLLSFISDFTSEFTSSHPGIEKFQIGDISAERGGFVSRHSSHQNGLDVDVVYLRVNKKGQDVDYPEWGEYFVKNGKLTRNFDISKNWQLFQFIISKGGVGRIFVDTAVKKKFCELYGSSPSPREKETLRRLRPAANHLTHFHLRLKCHKSYANCREQDDPSSGSGCANLIVESL
ncbi:penicillin-insensitive murein endopeptidase [Halobacteriovorax sp. JY17]|uniref:penicillin-insensitive murein endopeptidase n=1 Tax=Halobacteriovorax sp. JY17 TaxID=2014617 RepID=UPI000C5B7151|nr:penicillin-insensitive murein endopeptidase [Halobacteriovorax sp. JY17]PIK15591.1 MAG: hypothetical protein CES88_02385 [Halobacteriovorax sp. JY17]